MDTRRVSLFVAFSLIMTLHSATIVEGGKLAFSPDGRAVAYCEGNQIVLSNPITKVAISRFGYEHESTRAVSFLSNADMIISAGDGEFLRFWEVPSGRELRSFRVQAAQAQQFGPASTINTVALSPDDRIVASGGHGRNVTINLWDVRTGKVIGHMRGHRSAVYHVTFSPDGKVLASSSFDGTVRLWEVTNGREIRRFEGHGTPVYSVCFSPKGKTLASAGADKIIHIWDLETGKELRKFDTTNWLYDISFSPDGNYIASGGESKIVELWDVEAGRVIRQFRGHNGGIRSIAFSPNGRVLASLGITGEDIDIWYWELNLGMVEGPGRPGGP